MSANPRRDEQQLTEAMAHLKDFRLWAVKKKVNGWVIRQALIMTVELDEITAIQNGIKVEDLHKYDEQSREIARKWVEAQKKGL